MQGCLQAAVRIHSYDYYQEAIAERERQKMPAVGIAVDRRTIKHVMLGQKMNPPTSLVCACCMCQYTCIDGLHAEMGRIHAGDYFDMVSASSFRYNWSYKAYMDRFGSTSAMEQHPDLHDSSWTFRRILKHPRFQDQPILCCPADIVCSQRHSAEEIWWCCRLPLCRECSRDVKRHRLCLFCVWCCETCTETVLIFQYAPEHELLAKIKLVLQWLVWYLRKHKFTLICVSARVQTE